MKIVQEPAFVLHAKPYRETSLLVEFLTRNFGRVSAIARSARGPRSRFRGSLTPFTPLIIDGSNRTDLMQLTTAEVNGAAIFLESPHLFSGLYLNEILIRLLQRYDPFPELFDHYHRTLTQFTLNVSPQILLRQFEQKLLLELGYEIQLNCDALGNPVHPDQLYSYRPGQGLVLSDRDTATLPGIHLLAMHAEQFSDPAVLKTARQLMRTAIGVLLGNYQIKSRELFKNT